MSRPSKTGILTAALALASVAAIADLLRAQSGGAAAPTGRVACIDVVKVFGEYERQQDFAKELKERQTTLQAEDKRRREDLDKLQAELNKLDPTDPTYRQRATHVQSVSIDYKNWIDITQATIQREMGVWTAQFYRDLTAAVQAVGAQQGYDVVFYKDEFEMPANADPAAVRDQIRGRKVLYANPAVDISQLVLDKMNVEYRSKPKTPMLYIP